MWHHTGLSNGFWIYVVKAKLHTYNITPIKQADYKTPKRTLVQPKTRYLTSKSLQMSSLGAYSKKEET